MEHYVLVTDINRLLPMLFS